MNEFTSWVQDNWFALANLLSQIALLGAGVWFARKILKALRASQEQVGALLKLSVTGAETERPSPNAVAERSLANESPYWLTPSEIPAAGSLQPPQDGSRQRVSALRRMIVWLRTPMRRSRVAPWRRAVRWLQSPVRS